MSNPHRTDVARCPCNRCRLARQEERKSQRTVFSPGLSAALQAEARGVDLLTLETAEVQRLLGHLHTLHRLNVAGTVTQRMWEEREAIFRRALGEQPQRDDAGACFPPCRNCEACREDGPTGWLFPVEGARP